MKWRSKKYREFVARQPSFISGSWDRNAPHHIRKGTGGGTGLKPSDLYCVPVTWDEHALIHAGRLDVNMEEAFRSCLKCLETYLTEKGVR